MNNSTFSFEVLFERLHCLWRPLVMVCNLVLGRWRQWLSEDRSCLIVEWGVSSSVRGMTMKALEGQHADTGSILCRRGAMGEAGGWGLWESGQRCSECTGASGCSRYSPDEEGITIVQPGGDSGMDQPLSITEEEEGTEFLTGRMMIKRGMRGDWSWCGVQYEWIVSLCCLAEENVPSSMTLSPPGSLWELMKWQRGRRSLSWDRL